MLYRERYGRGTKGAGWYSFDANGVHFMGLVNVANGVHFMGLVNVANGVHFMGLVNVATGVRFMGLANVDNPGGKAGGLGSLGDEQLEWIEADLKGRSVSTPIVVFAHIPLWSVYPTWGWGTEDSARALSYMKRFGSVTVLNGHIHQVMRPICRFTTSGRELAGGCGAAAALKYAGGGGGTVTRLSAAGAILRSGRVLRPERARAG